MATRWAPLWSEEREIPRHGRLQRQFSSLPGFASCLAGSSPMIDGPQADGIHQPRRCLHDGFTLRDLASYNEKHNEANGEGGADGANDNRSWNCGTEGNTDRTNIELRYRQQRNS